MRLRDAHRMNVQMLCYEVKWSGNGYDRLPITRYLHLPNGIQIFPKRNPTIIYNI
jgi:hypothetical protein